MVYFLNNSEILVKRSSTLQNLSGPKISPQNKNYAELTHFSQEDQYLRYKPQSRLMRLQLKVSLRIIDHPHCTKALF